MSKTAVKGTVSALSIAMLLAACNGNDHDAPPGAKSNTPVLMKTLTVTPSLGKITNARVILRNAVTGAQLGERNTGTGGKVTFDVPASVSTVITEVQGGNGAQYFDEATGQMADMPAGAVLRAATTLVKTNSEIGVTALTEAAVQRAEALAGDASIVPFLNQAKAAIEQAFGVANILAAPTLVDETADLAALGTSGAEQYALRLATLAKVAHKQLGASETAPALKMAQALAGDFRDGNIDGSGANGPLPYDLASFAAEYQAQVLKLVQDFLASAGDSGFDQQKLQALLNYITSHPLKLELAPVAMAITSLHEPLTAAIGSAITLQGFGFNPDKSKMQVFFVNEVPADIVSASATQLVVNVPAGAVNGRVRVVDTETGRVALSLAPVLVGGPASDCGDLPTLTLDDLARFQGSYNVDIKRSNLDPVLPPELVKTATLGLGVNLTTAVARVVLNGVSANVTAVCQNGANKDNVMVLLDQANAHVDFNLFNGQKQTNGVDFSGAGEFFASSPGDGAGGGNCSGNISVAGALPSLAAASRAARPVGDGIHIVITPPPETLTDHITLSWPAVPGATSYRVNRVAATAGDSVIPQTVMIQPQTTTTYTDQDNVFVGGTYSYEVVANGASCSFPGVNVTVGAAIDHGGPWTTRLVGNAGQSLLNVAAKGDLLVAGGQGDAAVATQKSTDNGTTWQGLATGVGFNPVINGVAGNGAIIIAGGDGFLAKTSTGGAWTNIALPRPADMRSDGLFYVGAVQYVNNRFVLAGSYNNGLSSPFPRNVFVATSEDGASWTVKTPTLDGFNNGIDIAGNGAQLVIVYKGQAGQKILRSADNGLSWTIDSPDFGGGFNLLHSITTGINGKYYALGDYPQINLSDDGVLWRATATFDKFFMDNSCQGGLRGITSIDDKLMALCSTNGTANQSKLVVSADGRGWFVYGGLIDGIGHAVIKNNGRYIVSGIKAEKIGTTTFMRQFVSTMDQPAP